MNKNDRYWIEKIIKFPCQFLSKSIRVKNIARSKFKWDIQKWITLFDRYLTMIKIPHDQNFKNPFSLACINQNKKLFSKFELE